eukprot:TRINITY_DN24120_c0_g1_i1.p1 TRINITY_DN24120_c0_g1~~TRINITY_DN24120_c0_g1_i1.p1  ORF type:complete len:197 (+),score=20.50 TRINITY_DN24120_c0_g1_i1:80-592(+)
MYQHLYYTLAQHNRLDLIKGLILDSGPGPMGCRDNFFKKNYTDKTSMVFLPIALYSVNAANKIPLSENLRQMKDQFKALPKHYKYCHNVPWTGPFLTHEEKGEWPILLLYSKEDVLMPYTYLERMVEYQTKRNPGRNIVTNRFSGSGHVAHLKKSPEKYTNTVHSFMKSL